MLNDVELLCSAQYHIHARYVGNFAGLQLCIAAHHHDVGMGLVAESFADHLTAFPVVILRYRACVDHVDICWAVKRRGGIPCVLEDAADSRCFRKIQFTSQGIKRNSFAHIRTAKVRKNRKLLNYYRPAKLSVSSWSLASTSALLFRSLSTISGFAFCINPTFDTWE